MSTMYPFGLDVKKQIHSAGQAVHTIQRITIQPTEFQVGSGLMSLRVPSLKSALIEESKEDEHGTPVYKIHGYWFKQTDVTDNPLGVVQQSIWLLQSYRNNFLAAEDKPPITELDPLNQKKVRSYSN